MSSDNIQFEERMEWTPIDGGLRLNAETSDRYWKLVHTQYAFCVLTRGAAEWRYRGRSFTVRPGRFYVCEPGEVHGTHRTHGPGDYSVHFMDPEWMSQMSQELATGEYPHFPAEGLDDLALWTQLVKLSTANADHREEYNQRLSAVLSNVLFAEAATRPQLTAPTLLRARSELRERFFANPSQTIRISDVARSLKVGYHSLVHDFSRHFGAAPYEYVALLRRQYVLHLLRSGPSERLRSLSAIGRHAGYSDVAHMSRDMRKNFGHPPSELARQLNISWAKRLP